MRFLQVATLVLLITFPTSVSALPPGDPIDVPQLPTILLPQEEEIGLALSAGPEHLRAEATVYVFGKKGYERIRIGKLRLIGILLQVGLLR